ncbi:hypothetical protein MOQ_001469 [Trypanosoma cruzi marinkellei]|uniref:Uncharacterized protein n=1 Tax=Trypanosoma cruzi marinkellei TaxID=85056 RepID=K2NTG2_TRYCR|nr:hypothetical protein MOQ_001469 [Trypanosoma cruzi marinkellei]
MVAALDEGTSRRSCNRAVASVTAIDTALLDSALITGGLTTRRPLPFRAKPIVRYASMSSLIQEQLKPDPHRWAREALHALQTVPVLRDEFALMDDATLRCICAFLGDRSRELLQIGSVCRRLREFVIALTPSNATVVPDMIPLASLSSHTVVDSLCSFFASYKRGQLVQKLHLVDSKYASSLSVSTSLPLCSHHLYPSLVKSLLSLIYLDLRGVQWDCNSNPHIPQYFFSDLYLFAPKLQTLKIGVDLFLQWSPGWWQRLPELEQIVVGSRRDQAAVPGSELRPPLNIHDEFFDMLRAPRRPWRVKLWCPLQLSALTRLLLPAQAFPELRELTVNLSNMNVLEEFKRSAIRSPRENRPRKGAKNATVHSVDETDARFFFVSLQSLTLANVEQFASLPAELIARILPCAPHLSYFSVVNTARVPPPPPPSKLKRRV